MTANAMFVSEKEPLLVVSVAHGHLTDRLIAQSGTFTLGIAAEDQKKLAVQLGSAKGDAGDKLKRFGIGTLDLPAGGAPVPEGVAGWMRCTVESTAAIGGYNVHTARVTARKNFARPPLVWHMDAFFSLKPASP